MMFGTCEEPDAPHSHVFAIPVIPVVPPAGGLRLPRRAGVAGSLAMGHLLLGAAPALAAPLHGAVVLAQEGGISPDVRQRDLPRPARPRRHRRGRGGGRR